MDLDEITIEELRRRQDQRSTTPADHRKQCPECGSVEVIKKIERPGGTPRRIDTKYRCGNCQFHFDNPVRPDPEGDR